MGIEVFLLLAATAVVLGAVGVPLWLEKVPPNGFYGFRTPRTVSDPRVWYPANKVLGLDLMLSGLVSVAVSLAGLVAASVGIHLGPWIVAAWMAPLVIASLHGFWSASVTVARIDGHLPETPAKEHEAPRDPTRRRERSRGREGERS